jgi:hypothetical protein
MECSIFCSCRNMYPLSLGLLVGSFQLFSKRDCPYGSMCLLPYEDSFFFFDTYVICIHFGCQSSSITAIFSNITNNFKLREVKPIFLSFSSHGLLLLKYETFIDILGLPSCPTHSDSRSLFLILYC